MEICVCSDLHGRHRDIEIPEADVLCVCGDLVYAGNIIHMEDFLEWIQELPHQKKIIIAGNHDFPIEKNTNHWRKRIRNAGGIYLQDESVLIDGVNFYGSPWNLTPGWAFGDSSFKEVWDKIPNNTDVLMTHSPPYKILDQSSRGIRYGCPNLEKVVKRIKPKYHIFGHIHKSFGETTIDETTYINSSIWYDNSKPVIITI